MLQNLPYRYGAIYILIIWYPFVKRIIQGHDSLINKIEHHCSCISLNNASKTKNHLR